jgi:hypothetical protein
VAKSARRPDLFDRAALEQSLRDQGCAESFISPTVSDFKLFVPLVFRELGEDKIFEIVENARAELGLGEQAAAWQHAIKYIVGWAEEAIEKYKAQRK